jgi:glycosyltransferase involved in cell wall biosynthesis
MIRIGGVPNGRSDVIVNIIDTAKFAPEAERRNATRRNFGVTDEFIGMAAGRIAPAKDYENQSRAFALLRAQEPACPVVDCG